MLPLETWLRGIDVTRLTNDCLQGERVQTPIMFTRLDSERNAKVMKRAVNEERLPVEKYQVGTAAHLGN